MANNSNQHHDTRPDGRLSRRDFVKAAVAIGGPSALSACLDREASQGPADTETSIEHEDGDLSVPRPADHGDRPDALHRWNDYLVTDASGNTVLPRHQVVLGLKYVGSTPPTDSERNVVNRAFEMLDRAFRWGTGDSDSAGVSDGLLWILGYSAKYFRQLGITVPERLITPDALVSAVGEQPSTADRFDAALVLTGDFGSIPLAAENALWGEQELLNGVTVDATLDGIFDRAVRRTGLTGKGVVAAELENDRVPENAPLSMGFRSGFQDNQPTEDAVTINEGPFAGGTTLAVSRLHIDIDRWYGQSTEERAAEMFCPAHDASEIGDTAESLGNSSRISPTDAEKIPTHAAEYDRIGHSQKLATARDDEFRPRILRRSEGVATDVQEGAGFNFTSIQSDIEEFVAVRRAMNVDDHDVDVALDNHGIIDYLETQGRTALVVPTRDDVGLPAP
jgi:deferrochelatase/peroxidase EfeB